jgi:hypothetical protein
MGVGGGEKGVIERKSVLAGGRKKVKCEREVLWYKRNISVRVNYFISIICAFQL